MDKSKYLRHETLVSVALREPWSFFDFNSRPNNGYHVKAHNKFCKNSKKIDSFKAKKVTGVKGRIWDIFIMQKMRKSFIKITTARNFILGLNDSSEATSSDDERTPNRT